jgi:MFS family permease
MPISAIAMPISLASIRRSQYAVATLFLILGFNFSTWASRIPALKTQLHLSTAEVGILLLACGLGAVFSFPVTATLLHKLGSRKLCVLAGAILPILLLCLAYAPTYPLAMTVMAVEGIVISCLNVAMNAKGVEVELAGQEPIMSRLHAVFSLGSLMAAAFASAITSFTDSIIMHFFVSALIIWMGLGLTIPHLLPDAIRAADMSDTTHIKLPSGMALWLGLIALCGTIVEGSMSDWSALYLKEITGASPQMAPMGIASVAGAMLLARWFGDGWRTRWNAETILTIGGLLASAGLALALIIGGFIPALLGFFLVGLGVAAVSPCVYAAAAKNGAVALAAVTTMGSIGTLLGPPVIGFIAHATNFSWGMATIAFAALMISVFTRRVLWS